jgi:glycosyltransferase involved in cell wall biosynthesis
MHILYFYPENPLLHSQGNNARALALLQYFKARNITVDFVGIASPFFTTSDIELLKKQRLIANGYLLPAFDRRRHKMEYFLKYSMHYVFDRTEKYFNQVRSGQQAPFDLILQKNKYDKLLISYVHWAALLSNSKNLKGAETIVDTHDFMTAQHKNASQFSLGLFFEREMKILKRFDTIFTISSDEKQLFSQFVENRVVAMTHPLPAKFQLQKLIKIYDIIYVASENNHNIKSVNWFFESVYPKLDKSYRFCIVGKITKHIPDYPNLTKIPFAESLDDFYSQSRIAICPMLSGTGLKIKVVEAMSFGLPIVCNERGVDGLLNKTNNGCLVTNDSFEFAEYIERLLTDNDFYTSISKQSQSYFYENFELESVYKKFDAFFKV